MTTSAIVINLVLAVVVTAFVAGTAFFVPFLLDRPAKARRATVVRAPRTSTASADREQRLAA